MGTIIIQETSLSDEYVVRKYEAELHEIKTPIFYNVFDRYDSVQSAEYHLNSRILKVIIANTDGTTRNIIVDVPHDYIIHTYDIDIQVI